MINYDDIEITALETFPEIWSDYRFELLDEVAELSLDDWICRLRELRHAERRPLGPTIVFENALSPLIIKWLSSDKEERLVAALDWLESLSHPENDQRTLDLVYVGFCEAILSNQREHLVTLLPHISVREHLHALFARTQADWQERSRI
ncbi:MAG: hypothetical protein KDE04_17725 [Anaerolineales bacterium]|nr:hypothetical protein [Anaerolineales bacterium]MCB0030539.1 hypothetical protein [Anaerolineales bacterium]